MAVVRPHGPNFGEMAAYREVLKEFDVTYFYTGPTLQVARRELEEIGVGAMRVRRYSTYTDFLPLAALRRAVDFKLGLGSWMLTGLAEVCHHDVVNIVDPIYGFAQQVTRRLTSSQKLVVFRWEVIPNRYDDIPLAIGRAGAVLSRADGVVCTTIAARDSLNVRWRHRPDGQKVAVIYPGIVLPAASSGVGDEPSLSIATVARLQWQKGLDDLIAAVALLRQSYGIATRLSVIGSGDPKPWRALARRYQVEDLVAFLGSLPNAEVRGVLSKATLYCQPSAVSKTWCEQFGFAVVEAMACARPVVVSLSGVLPEIVGPAGVYVPTRNASSLANALAQLIRDPDAAQERGRRLATYARDRYDAHKQGLELLRFLDAL